MWFVRGPALWDKICYTKLQVWQVWYCFPEAWYLCQPFLHLEHHELAAAQRCVQHFDPVQPPHLGSLCVDNIRKGAKSVPDSCLPLVQLDACVPCVPHQWFCQNVEQKPHTVRFAREVDVVPERAQELSVLQ